MAVEVGAIGGELGMALLKGVAGQIGAKIFNSIFPQSGEPDYFGDVYIEIDKIVKEEIEQNTIDEIDGEINGIKDWVEYVYTPRKDAGASKEELSRMIQQDEYDIAVHMVAVLQEKAYAEPGLGVFVIGAGMHLTLLQELALVDPLQSNPNISSYAESVKMYAENYADFADATYDSIENKRTNDTVITPVKTSSRQYEVAPHQPPATLFETEWKDTFIGKTFNDATTLMQTTWTSGTVTELQQRSEKTRSDYILKVKEDLAKDLNDPKGVANMWRQLKEQPIPVIS